MIRQLYAAILIFVSAGMCFARQGDPKKASATLVVGWHDEMDSPNWPVMPKPHTPDISARHKGFLRLSLGDCAMEPSPAPFSYATVSGEAEVDVERYPILAVRAVALKGPSWWDVSIQGENRNRQAFGKEIKTPSLNHDGIILFDLAPHIKQGPEVGSRFVRIRLNIAGTKKGGSVEYDWIRFVRRQDLERLRENPHISEFIVEP